VARPERDASRDEGREQADELVTRVVQRRFRLAAAADQHGAAALIPGRLETRRRAGVRQLVDGSALRALRGWCERQRVEPRRDLLLLLGAQRLGEVAHGRTGV